MNIDQVLQDDKNIRDIKFIIFKNFRETRYFSKDDAFQEVVIRLPKKLKIFDSARASLSTFLNVAVTSIVQDLNKSNLRRKNNVDQMMQVLENDIRKRMRNGETMRYYSHDFSDSWKGIFIIDLNTIHDSAVAKVNQPLSMSKAE